MRPSLLLAVLFIVLALGARAEELPPAVPATTAAAGAPVPPADDATAPPASPETPSDSASAGAPPVTELPGVEANAKRDAFSKSDAKLKALIDGLPCNGCDVKKKIEAKKSWTEKSVTFALKECCIPTTPPPIDEAGAVTHDVAHEERRPPNLNP